MHVEKSVVGILRKAEDNIPSIFSRVCYVIALEIGYIQPGEASKKKAML